MLFRSARLVHERYVARAGARVKGRARRGSQQAHLKGQQWLTAAMAAAPQSPQPEHSKVRPSLDVYQLWQLPPALAAAHAVMVHAEQGAGTG